LKLCSICNTNKLSLNNITNVCKECDYKIDKNINKIEDLSIEIKNNTNLSYYLSLKFCKCGNKKNRSAELCRKCNNYKLSEYMSEHSVFCRGIKNVIIEKYGEEEGSGRWEDRNEKTRGENAWNYGLTGELCHNFGRLHTEEEKQQISETLKYQFANERIQWNTGLTKETSDGVRKQSENVSITLKDQFANGRIQWNKGLTGELSHSFGIPLSDECKKIFLTH